MKFILSLASVLGFATISLAQNLGTAAAFGVLGASTVTNTGSTIVNGSVGVFPGTAITGFPPGAIVPPGVIHADDATAQGAQADVSNAYTVLAGLAPTAVLTGDLGGRTLVAGVYKYTSSAGLTGTLTLDGQFDPNSVWVFQIGSTLITASNSAVVLVNGASPCNIFWQVGSSATLGTGTDFVGNILASTSITLNTGAVSDGGLFALNEAVTLDSNIINIEVGCNTGLSGGTTTTTSTTSTTSSTGTGTGGTGTGTGTSTTSTTSSTTGSTTTSGSSGTGTSNSTTTSVGGGLSTTTGGTTTSRTRGTHKSETNLSISQAQTLFPNSRPIAPNSRPTPKTKYSETLETYSIHTTRSFTVTCPFAPTTITSYDQIFAIPTPCTTVLTCTPEITSITVVVFTTSCGAVPTTITTRGESFTITTPGICTLSCTKCVAPEIIVENQTTLSPTAHSSAPGTPAQPASGTRELPASVKANPQPSMYVFMGMSSKVAPTQIAGFILALCFLFLF